MEFEREEAAKEVYHNLLKRIVEGNKEDSKVFLWAHYDMKLLLKEEMLSVLASSNYKSECLELNTFNYYPDINSPTVDIPENFKSLYLKNIGGLNEFIRSRTFPYIKTVASL